MKATLLIKLVAISFFASVIVYLISCQTMHPIDSKKNTTETIGVAHLADDGLLEVTLRATGDNGTAPVGDAFFVYRKGTPDYELFMKLVGGLRPGETKPVPASPKNEPTRQ